MRWLHKDQKIYIDNIVAKLGIDDNQPDLNHRRASSLFSNNQRYLEKTSIDRRESIHEGSTNSRIPSLKSSEYNQ